MFFTSLKTDMKMFQDKTQLKEKREKKRKKYYTFDNIST